MLQDMFDRLAKLGGSLGLDGADPTQGAAILTIAATLCFLAGAMLLARRPVHQVGRFGTGVLIAGLGVFTLFGVFLLLDPPTGGTYRVAKAEFEPFATPDPTRQAGTLVVERRPDVVAAQSERDIMRSYSGASETVTADAIAGHLDAIATARAANDLKGEAWALLGLGEAELAQGHITRAARALETALVQFAMIEDYPGTIRALVQLGLVRQAYGEEEAAKALFADARMLDVSLGEPVGVATELKVQGLLE